MDSKLKKQTAPSKQTRSTAIKQTPPSTVATSKSVVKSKSNASIFGGKETTIKENEILDDSNQKSKEIDEKVETSFFQKIREKAGFSKPTPKPIASNNKNPEAQVYFCLNILLILLLLLLLFFK